MSIRTEEWELPWYLEGLDAGELLHPLHLWKPLAWGWAVRASRKDRPANLAVGWTREVRALDKLFFLRIFLVFLGLAFLHSFWSKFGKRIQHPASALQRPRSTPGNQISPGETTTRESAPATKVNGKHLVFERVLRLDLERGESRTSTHFKPTRIQPKTLNP